MADIDDVMDKLDDVLNKIADNKEKLDEEKSVQQICWHCGGDGIKGSAGNTTTCPDCGGDGVRPFARITKKTDE